MPTKHETWTCDICGRLHNLEAGALQCEARGRPPALPVGCIVRDGPYMRHLEPPIYKILFVIGCVDESKQTHVLQAGAWAWRDIYFERGVPYQTLDNGPTNGGETCNVPFDLTARLRGLEPTATADPDSNRQIDTAAPRYARMFRALEAAGITPTYWNGQEAVPAPSPMEPPR